RTLQPPLQRSRRALLHRISAIVAAERICHNAAVSLIPASMIPALPGRDESFRVLETLVIGTAGGMLFMWAHLPGGLISGAMISVGIAAIAGRHMSLPPVMTQTVLVLLGISLGSLVSRQLIQHVSAYPLTIGLMALATFFSTFGSSFYLQRLH